MPGPGLQVGEHVLAEAILLLDRERGPEMDFRLDLELGAVRADERRSGGVDHRELVADLSLVS